MRAIILTSVLGVVLTACSSDQAQLDGDGVSRNGPNEFEILPMRPLVMPESLALPTPVTGVANRADPTPLIDAIVALGGRAS